MYAATTRAKDWCAITALKGTKPPFGHTQTAKTTTCYMQLATKEFQLTCCNKKPKKVFELKQRYKNQKQKQKKTYKSFAVARSKEKISCGTIRSGRRPVKQANSRLKPQIDSVGRQSGWIQSHRYNNNNNNEW